MTRALLSPLVVSLALALVALPACQRKREPSAAYEEAHQRFSALYAQKLEEAFEDPSIAEIESLLSQVGPQSLDAEDARALEARIKTGQAQAAQRQAQREEDQDALNGSEQAFALPAESPPAPVAAAPVDAGPVDTGPRVGTLESELVGGFRGCFRQGAPVNLEGSGPRTRWEMVDRLSCRQEYPSLAESFLLVDQGKVLLVSPNSALQRLPRDAGR